MLEYLVKHVTNKLVQINDIINVFLGQAQKTRANY